jgi:hypothetical protein
MRRRISVASLVVAAVVLAACSDKPLPTSPELAGPRRLGAGIGTDGCVDGSLEFLLVNAEVTNLIVNLFEGSHEQSTLAMWENLKKDKLESRPLQNHIDNLTKWTLEHLAAGNLLDPDGPGLFNATTGSVRMLDLIFDCTGDTPSQVPEPPEGFDAAFELVDPSEDNDQQFNTSFGDGAAFLPRGSLRARSMLVIVRQPDDVKVNTPFPLMSRVTDVALAGGGLKQDRKISVLFCPIRHDHPHELLSRLVVAHQKTAFAPGAPIGEGVEYLDPPEGGNLPCSHDLSDASWREERGFLRQRAMQFASLARRAWRMVGPRTLYAGHAAIGGSTPFGSPMVLVDPYVETEIVITDVSPNPATFGETVSATARLRIRDIAANPAIYRGTFVNPDVVTGVVNKTETRNTNLPMAARVDEGARTAAVTDDVNSAASWAFQCVDAGSHAVTVDFAETIVVANAPHYGASTASAPLVVNRRDLTITANNKTRQYGDANPALDGSLEGVQSQCDPPSSFTQVYTTDATAATEVSSAVGARPIVPDVQFGEGARAENYNLIRINGALTIEPRPLAISASDHTREYGVASAFTGVIGERGLVNDDQIVLAFATVPPTDATTDVGTYPIVPSAVVPEGAVDRRRNYLITATNGTLRITPAPLAFNIGSASRMYGDPNPLFTHELVGLRNDDAIEATLFSAAIATTPVGSAVIDGTLAGAKVHNYDVTKTTGTLTITHRPLSVTADDAQRLYGDANPAFTGVVTNAVAGDGLVVTYTSPATVTDNAGSYPIVPHVGGAAASNYAPINLTNGTLTVSPAPLDIGANSFSRLFGNANPSFTGSAVGVKNGDFIAVLARPNGTVTPLSPVGTYVLVPFLAEAYNNYCVRSETNGTLTITPRPLTGAIDDKQKVQGEPNPTLTGTVNGIVTGSGYVATFATPATTTSPDGTYPITLDLSGTGGSNYTWVGTNGTLTVIGDNFTLSVTGTGAGSITSNFGLDCDVGCTSSTRLGQGTYTFTANPAENNYVQWGGAASPCATDLSCTVTVGAGAVNVTAAFQRGVNVLVQFEGDDGDDTRVRSTPARTNFCDTGPNANCTFTFAPNSTIQLGARQGGASHAVAPNLLGWSGVSGCSAPADCTITLGTTDLTVTAILTVPVKGLQAGAGSGVITSNPAGINCATPTSCATQEAEVAPGQPITLTATPNAGSLVDHWNATTGSAADIAAVRACGSATTCTFTPQRQTFAIVNWKGDPSSAATVSISVSGTGGGRVVGSFGVACPDIGCSTSTVLGPGTYQLSRFEEDGSYFVGWGGDAASCGTDFNCTITVGTADFNATAQFDRGVNIIVQRTGAMPLNGHIESVPRKVTTNCGPDSPVVACTFTFAPGATVVLQAREGGSSFPTASFLGWSGVSGCPGNADCTITLGTSDLTVTAIWSVPVRPVIGGTAAGRMTSNPAGIDCASGENCSADVVHLAAGQSVTLTAIPSAGAQVDRWDATANASDAAAVRACGSSTSCTFTPTGAVTARLFFRPSS